jgi:exodeoxyribonuclease-3
MKIATYNINSIRSRLDALLGWMSENQPDIVCLQETKVQDSEFPSAPLIEAGYHVAFKGMKAYNGVAILSREKPDEIRAGLDDGGPADEPRLIRARFGRLHVVNTYVPQGREIDHEMFAYKLAWLRRLRGYFDRHFTSRDRLLWVGDLNVAAQPIDVYNPEARAQHVCYHADAREALAFCQAWGFDDVLRAYHPEGGHYTFFDYRTADSLERGWGWRIDYIMASPAMMKNAVDCRIDLAPRRQAKASDHTYLVAEFKG